MTNSIRNKSRQSTIMPNWSQRKSPWRGNRLWTSKKNRNEVTGTLFKRWLFIVALLTLWQMLAQMLQIICIDHYISFPLLCLMFWKIKYPKVNSLANKLSLQQTNHEGDICGTRLIELRVLRNGVKSCSKKVSVFCGLHWEVSCSNSMKPKAKW